MSDFATFQKRVRDWLLSTFSKEIAESKVERNARFIEEALELVQSTGMTKEEALFWVDYVYGRPAGDPPQEVGGVLVCLAALCSAHRIPMVPAAETELNRAWYKQDKIKAKHATKPQYVKD